MRLGNPCAEVRSRRQLGSERWGPLGSKEFKFNSDSALGGQVRGMLGTPARMVAITLTLP